MSMTLFRPSDKCICGHGEMTHTLSCHVTNCQCKRFTKATESKSVDKEAEKGPGILLSNINTH
jgi:hypothetical protein